MLGNLARVMDGGKKWLMFRRRERKMTKCFSLDSIKKRNSTFAERLI